MYTLYTFLYDDFISYGQCSNFDQLSFIFCLIKNYCILCLIDIQKFLCIEILNSHNLYQVVTTTDTKVATISDFKTF